MKRYVLLALLALTTACGKSQEGASSGTAPLAEEEHQAVAALAVNALLADRSSPAVARPVLGERNVLVILVDFGKGRPWSREEVRRVVFDDVDAFVRAASDGRTWLAGDVAGWFTIPAAKDHRAIADAARNAAREAGVRVDSYPHLVIAFPALPGGTLGDGTIGGVPTIAWINGSLDVRTIAHELGHNFGLRHARALAGTSVVEYGDPESIMGGGAGTFTAPERFRLGWLDRVEEVSASGTLTLDEDVPLRIARGRTTYWVESRGGVPVVRLEDEEGDLLLGRGSYRDDQVAIEGARGTVTVTLGRGEGGLAVVDLVNATVGSRTVSGALVVSYARAGALTTGTVSLANLALARDGRRVGAVGHLQLDAHATGGTVTGHVNGEALTFPFAWTGVPVIAGRPIAVYQP